jgi:hypothetical protein
VKKLMLTYALVASAVLAGTAIGGHRALASDHDDGQSDVKTQSTNLTDLYVFREVDQDAAATAGNMVMVMNCNPRSLPQTQYYFNTNARYEFHVTAAGTGTAAPTGQDDTTLRYEFGAPDATTNIQPVTLTMLQSSGATVIDTKTFSTTPFTAGAMPTALTVATMPVKAFAGTRQDTFFFDVEQFFKVRKAAEQRYLGVATPAVGFNPTVASAATAAATDFTAGYNVLTIAASVPMALLRPANDTTSTVFDVWETISVKM